MKLNFGHLTLAGLLFTALSGTAATVQLNNGKIVDGDVVRQDPLMIWMNINGATYELSRSNVLWFSSDKVSHSMLRNDDVVGIPYRREPMHISGAVVEAVPVQSKSDVRTPNLINPNQRVTVEVPLPATPAPMIRNPKDEIPISTNYVAPSAPVAVPVTPGKPEVLPHLGTSLIPTTATTVPVTAPRTEADINRLRRAIPQLSDAADPADNREASEALRASGDTGLAMLIQDGLYNSIPSVRTHSVELLATLGGTRVLKPLIEAFHAAAVPTIPSYQVGYVTTLTGQISRLTGQDYYFYARRTARAPEIAAQMVSWWNVNLNRFPQLGEAPIDPNAPNAAQLVRQARTLVLIHRDFGGANLPQEVAPQLTVDDATTLLNGVNGIPRASDNSFTDRLNTAQEPSVPKIPDDALSAPGKWREEQQAERLREEKAR